MPSFKTNVLLAAAFAARTVLAHTTFTEFYVDGVSNGPGTCMRMSKIPGQSGSPIADIAGTDMVCGVSGLTGVDRICSAKAGQTVTFEAHSWADDKSKPVLDRGHLGPCAVYMKKVDNALKDSGEGDGWFKIWDEGYVDGKWCTEKLIDNGGLLSVKIPEVTAGNYLIRPELLALHAAIDAKDPQFYAGCAQIALESSGNLAPITTVSIPGYVQKENLGWNLYYGMDPNTYKTPGPAVTDFSATGVASQDLNAPSGDNLPEGCILQNGNFCAFEVPEYADETGCWAAGENCWTQNERCWDEAPATGGQGCKELEKRCEALNQECRNKNFQGPPNAGSTLWMGKTTLVSIPAAQTAAAGGNVVDGGNAPVPTQPEQEQEEVDTPAAPAPAPFVPTSAAQAPEVQPAPTAVQTYAEEVVAGDNYEEKSEEQADSPAAPVVTPAPTFPTASVPENEFDDEVVGVIDNGVVTITDLVVETLVEYLTVYI